MNQDITMKSPSPSPSPPPEPEPEPEPTTTQQKQKQKPKEEKKTKSRTLTESTIRAPQFAYAHLRLHSATLSEMTNTNTNTTDFTTDDNNDEDGDQNQNQNQTDPLQVRAYCTAALRQFLGDTGAGMGVDILLIRGGDVWVRVPRGDLAAFVGAIAAYGGMETTLFRTRACGDWLGSLLGRAEQHALWAS